MSDLFDKLVEGAGQVLSEVDKRGQIQTAIGGLRQRLAEADRKRKVALLKQQIQELQMREAQAINALSAQVLALHEAGTLAQPELLSLCKGVDDVRLQIRQREAELVQLQPPVPAVPVAAAPVSLPAQAGGVPGAGGPSTCRQCGAATVAGAAYCQACGARLTEAGPKPGEPPPSAPPPRFCIQCGAQLRQNARFCPMCGHVVSS